MKTTQKEICFNRCSKNICSKIENGICPLEKQPLLDFKTISKKDIEIFKCKECRIDFFNSEKDDEGKEYCYFCRKQTRTWFVS